MRGDRKQLSFLLNSFRSRQLNLCLQPKTPRPGGQDSWQEGKKTERMPKQMMIFSSLYQNNGSGRDTFINLYRKGSGRTSEPGGYQGNCGSYGSGMTKFSGFVPYIEPEEAVDIKPYSCHKELKQTRPSTTSPMGRLQTPSRFVLAVFAVDPADLHTAGPD